MILNKCVIKNNKKSSSNRSTDLEIKNSFKNKKRI